jgi:hypothetical protein
VLEETMTIDMTGKGIVRTIVFRQTAQGETPMLLVRAGRDMTPGLEVIDEILAFLRRALG